MIVAGPQKKEDSIDRAGWLLQRGYVKFDEREGVLVCWSQALGEGKTYDVTQDSCTCFIGEYQTRVICKHRWAAFGSLVVCMILEIRAATSECDLESIAAVYKDGLQDLNPDFVARARDEYRLRLEWLRRTNGNR